MRAIAVLLVMLAGIAAAQQWQVVTLSRVTLEGASKDGGSFEVRVDSDTPKQTAGEYFGGTPQSVVSGIIVKTQGARIAFPREAVADLANPLLQTASITSQPGSNLKVEYFIEGNRLVRRTVSYFERGGVQKDRVVKTTNF